MTAKNHKIILLQDLIKIIIINKLESVIQHNANKKFLQDLVLESYS